MKPALKQFFYISRSGQNMHESRLDVFLLGQPQVNVTLPTLVQNLALAFKKDTALIEKMLSRSRCLIKADVEPALAEKYRKIIHEAGGTCELVASTKSSAPISASASTTVTPTPASNSHSQISSSSPNLPTSPTSPNVQAPPVTEARPSNINRDTVQVEQNPQHYCYKCGKSINPELAKCPYCATPKLAYVSKDKFTAVILSFLFGGLGVHRFYLGQWWGIFYLIFWSTLIPSIISIIEALVFLLTPQKKWEQKYGQVARSGNATVVLIVVAVFLFVAITGILAAVAIPAYHDYTVRAKINGAMPLVNNTRDKVTAYIKQAKTFPNNNASAELPDKISGEFITSIKLQGNANIEVVFNIDSLKESNTLILSPSEKNGEITWSCLGGTLNDRFREPKCRNGMPATSSDNSTQAAASNATKTLQSQDLSISIDVPNSWSKNDSLLAEAVLGAAQMRDENYLIVLKDSRIDFEKKFTLSDYTRVVQKSMQSEVKNAQLVGEVTKLSINNAPAEQFVLTGSADGLRVAYLVTSVETDHSYYRVVAWTLLSRLDTNKSVLHNASTSIKFKN
jgi:TM2 domain-containing membrane protein YozV/Tfp pilus assembly protein PilE